MLKMPFPSLITFKVKVKLLLCKVWKLSWTPGKKTPNINVLHSRLAGLNADHCTNPHAFWSCNTRSDVVKPYTQHWATLQGYGNTISSTRISLRVTAVPLTAGSEISSRLVPSQCDVEQGNLAGENLGLSLSTDHRFMGDPTSSAGPWA